jgi:hypothetical protein
MISVVIARCVHVSEETIRWQIDPNLHEGRLVTLLARLDHANTSFLDFHVLPNLGRRKRSMISLDDPWLKRGQPISDFVAFCDVVKRVRALGSV